MVAQQALLQKYQQSQLAAGNLISLGKTSASKDRKAGQEGVHGGAFCGNNEERSTGETSNQGQAMLLPLNAAAAGKQTSMGSQGETQGGAHLINGGNGPLTQQQMQMLLSMHLLQQSMPAGG